MNKYFIFFSIFFHSEINIDVEEVVTQRIWTGRTHLRVRLRTGSEILRCPSLNSALRVAGRHHQVADLPQDQFVYAAISLQGSHLGAHGLRGNRTSLLHGVVRGVQDNHSRILRLYKRIFSRGSLTVFTGKYILNILFVCFY